MQTEVVNHIQHTLSVVLAIALCVLVKAQHTTQAMTNDRERQGLRDTGSTAK